MAFSNARQSFRLLILPKMIKPASYCCFFSSKPPQLGVVKEIDPDTGDSVSVTTLQEAEKLSKRRDLKLVRIVDLDTKTQRPVYKLMSGQEYHAEDLKQREQRKLEKQQQLIKGEKVLLLNSRIATHDLETQLRKAIKWIQKMYEVRVIINGTSGTGEASEKVYCNIENYFNKSNVPTAKIHQKVAKGSDIKFQITPVGDANDRRVL